MLGACRSPPWRVVGAGHGQGAPGCTWSDLCDAPATLSTGRCRGGLSQVQGGSGDSAWLLGDESVLQQRHLGQVAKGVLEGNFLTLDAPAVRVLVVKPRHKRKVVEKGLVSSNG